jgi:chromosome segregation ATPase
MADFGIPMTDQTKLSGGFSTPPLPSTQPQLAPTQPPITTEAEQKARAGQQFAWAANQSKQVTGIQDTRDTEFRNRAARVAINQATEQTKAQSEAVKAQVAAVEGEIAQINSQIAAIQEQIRAAQAAAAQAAAQAAAARAERDRIVGSMPPMATAESVRGIQTGTGVISEQSRLENERDLAAAQANDRYNANQSALVSAFVNRRAEGYDQRTGKDLFTPEQRATDQRRIAQIETDYAKIPR